MLSIILPTYNESKNLPVLVPLIDWHLTDVKYQIVVIDDNSPDGTAKVARLLKKKGYPIKVVVRKNERGLSSATVRGFREAKYEYVAVMDSDMQHNPMYLPKMLTEIQKGHSMVIGSRYVKGGSVEKFNPFRRFVSRMGILLFTKLLTGVKDPLGQFFIVRKSIVEDIDFSLIGFRTSLEIIVKAGLKDVKEIPIRFRNRYAGESKLTLKSALKDLEQVIRLYQYRFHPVNFWKFVLKGDSQVL